MTTLDVAKELNISDRQVRNLIREGVIPATRTGKVYVIEEDFRTRMSATYQTYRHRNRRPKRVSRKPPQPITASSYYWINNPVAAHEVARIARQVFKTPSTVSIEELTPGECYWRVSNPAVRDADTWAEMAEVAYKFLREQGIKARTQLVRKCARDLYDSRVRDPWAEEEAHYSRPE